MLFHGDFIHNFVNVAHAQSVALLPKQDRPLNYLAPTANDVTVKISDFGIPQYVWWGIRYSLDDTLMVNRKDGSYPS